LKSEIELLRENENERVRTHVEREMCKVRQKYAEEREAILQANESLRRSLDILSAQRNNMKKSKESAMKAATKELKFVSFCDL
jgi:predicted nucleic acid-binding protein